MRVEVGEILIESTEVRRGQYQRIILRDSKEPSIHCLRHAYQNNGITWIDTFFNEHALMHFRFHESGI